MQKLIINLIILLLLWQCGIAVGQTNLPSYTLEMVEHQKRLEAKLEKTLMLLEQNQAQIKSLTDEVAELKVELFNEQIVHGIQDESEDVDLQDSTSLSKARIAPNQRQIDSRLAFTERILDLGLGGDERENELSLRPEIFIQTRYSSLPKDSASIEDIESNFPCVTYRDTLVWTRQRAIRFGFRTSVSPRSGWRSRRSLKRFFH